MLNAKFVQKCNQAERRAKKEKQAFANFLLTRDNICNAFSFDALVEDGTGGLILSKKSQKMEISFEFFSKWVVGVTAFCEIMVLSPKEKDPFRVQTREEAVAFLERMM